MPRPRRSAKNMRDHTSIADENVATAPATSTLSMRKKRTLESTDTIEATPLIAQPTIVNRPPKKARKASPLFSPLPHDSPTHISVSDRVDSESDKGDGSEVEAEADWFDDPQDEHPLPQATSKRLATTTNERVEWQEPVSNPGTTSLGMSDKTEVNDIDGSLKGSSSGAMDTAPVTASPTWPVETEVIWVPGSKMKLARQSALLTVIFRDAFDNVRKDLLFQHAFPSPPVIPAMVRKCVVDAARKHTFLAGCYNASAACVHQRVLSDEVYEAKMIRLPRARISTFRGEVKEQCAEIVQIAFLPIQLEATIMEVVAKQLSNYNYTYPIATAPGVKGLPKRSKLYRNDRIISVIRNLFFSGGTLAIAHRFDAEFPKFKRPDGVLVHEMPVPMVALVATALYAAIREWRTGEHKSAEFSADAYLDVYNGHILTIQHIKASRSSAFHIMMADIYSLASSNVDDPNVLPNPNGLPIADLDLDEIN